MQDVKYSAEGRPAAPFGVPGLAPDYRRGGCYGLLGYRTPFWGIMPFAGIDHSEYGDSAAAVPSTSAVWGGLNIRPTPRVVLKAQMIRVWFPSNTTLARTMPTVDDFDVQAAWSF